MTTSHSEKENEEEVCEKVNVPVSPTHKLAYFFWHDISGNEGSFDDAFLDVNFVRRLCSNAKHVLKQGADLETIKLALTIMRGDGVQPYSPQQAVDWTRRSSGGMSYYQSAEAEIKKRDAQPPVWDHIAYAEWEVRRDRQLHRAAKGSDLQSDN